MAGPLSEETKRKISEALKKRYGNRSQEAEKFYSDYQSSQGQEMTLKGQADKIKATLVKIKGRGSKALRAKLHAQLKKINEQRKTEYAKRKAIVEQAHALKRVKKAQDIIAQQPAREAAVKEAEARIGKLLTTAKSPEQKARLQGMIDRIKAARERIASAGEQAKAILEAGGKKADTFLFTEHLSEKPYKPFRKLTTQEERVGFEALNTNYNDLEAELEDELAQATADEIKRVSNNVQNKLDAEDYAGIAALLFLFRGKIKEILNGTIKSAYDVGQRTASKELGIAVKSVPQLQTKIMNLDAAATADDFASQLENVTKSTIKNAVVAGAATTAITAAARDKAKDEASKLIANISGTVVGQNVNRGRNQVFKDNLPKIKAFERSEVLDAKTCNMCLTLDGRVVKADDPIAQMDIVHSSCRGVWVPIFEDDVEQPDLNPLPKSALENFDLVDGRPLVNNFKQLKKPVNSHNEEVQALIKKKLK